jgi:outer membrane protein TolC
VDQAKEVRTYRSVLDAGVEPVEFVPGEPLSLEEALALANQHNERLGIQGENYLQALIDKRRAAAAFLPTINLVPSYFRQDPITGGETGGQSRDARTDVPVNARMLLSPVTDVANLRAAARTIEQQRALLLDLQAIVLLETAQTYYQVLLAERSVEVLRNSLKVQEERLRDTRGRQAAGVGRALDVAQTAAQLAATRVTLISAMNDVRTGREALALLVGAPVQQSPLVDAVDPPVELLPLPALIDEALGQRQDLAAARAAIEASRFAVKAAVGQYYPSVSLNFNAFLSRDSNPTESDWNAVLSANLPIFSAGLIEADVRTAWSLLRQAVLSESLTRREVETEVTTAYLNLLSSRTQLDELEVQVQAAEEALRQAEQSYKAGLATNLEWVTAQDAVLTAQLQLTSARLDYKVFYLTLLRAMGDLSTRLPGDPAPATQPATLPVAQPLQPTTRPIVQ